MTIPIQGNGLLPEVLQIHNADVATEAGLAFANVPRFSDAFVKVRPVRANVVNFTALMQVPLMEKWVGGINAKQVTVASVILKTEDYDTTIAIRRADYESDAAGAYADLGFRMGEVGAKHQDYEAVKVLQCGWAADQTTFFSSEAAPGANGSPGTAALTGDALFSTSHALDPNAAGGVVYGPDFTAASANKTSAGQQTNQVSGSNFNSILIAKAHDIMINYTGDQGQAIPVTPRWVLHPPQQSTPVRQAIGAEFNPVVAANSAIATSAATDAANLALTNVVAGYGLTPILARELNKNPNVCYLVGEIPGLKAMTYAQFYAPRLVPSVTPQNVSVFNHKQFEWKMEDNVCMVAPLWFMLVRMSVLGS